MIDATHLKAAGWQRVVAELTSGAPDDRAFMDRMLRILTQVSAARQSVLFVPISASGGGVGGEGEAVPLAVFPPLGSMTDEAQTAAAAAAPPDLSRLELGPQAKRAALAALESGSSHVFAMESDTELYDGASGPGYVMSLALPGEGGKSAGAVTLLIEPRSKQAIQSTLAMAEVIIGYVHGHAARQELKRQVQTGRSLDLATRLIGAINTASGFKGATIQLVNDLAKTLSADRVALGWVRGDSIRVQAISDTEHFDRRMTMVQKMQSAMDECLDQDQAVVHPPPSSQQDMLLSQAISHAHKELAAGESKLNVVSIPLRDHQKVLGVLTIESRTAEATGVDLKTVELIQAAMDLVSPVLAVRYSDDRMLPLRAVDSAVHAGRWFVGSKHTVWKLAGLAVVIAMIVVTVVSTTYRVGATVELRPRERRVVSMPLDGVIKSLGEGIEAGVLVKAGQVLVMIDDADLRLQAEDARARLVTAEKQMSQAMKEQKTPDAKRFEAQRDQAKAQLDLYESRIARARVVAPIDGTIISGSLKDKIGASAKLGEELFQIAPLGDMMAVARVDESDVALIAEGGVGKLATRSRPGDEFEITIEKIVPLAEARDGKNQFEVRVKLNSTAAWMRPGMEGRVNLEAGQHTLIWIGTRRLVDAVRLWLW